jgi:glycosyltransferase involved in cell wall biosynthesis
MDGNAATPWRPRILFVAMQGSIHAARWIECLADRGWDLHMFGANDAPPNPNLRGVTLHVPLGPPQPAPVLPTRLQRLRGYLSRLWQSPRATLAGLPARLRETLHRRFGPAPPLPGYRLIEFRPDLDAFGVPPDAPVPVGEGGATAQPMWSPPVLAEVIDRVRPDLIHSMEFQHNSYRVLEALPLLATPRPAWLVTNWGSDILLFGRQPGHAETIRCMLETADFYSCECRRDLALGRQHGYAGPFLPVLPNSGGMDLAQVAQLRDPHPPSRRRRIMVKGYDHFAGRAMVSLAVLERFAPQLRRHEIILYSVGARPRVKALELKKAGVLNIRVIDWATHEQMLRFFGSARFYLGISLSDGISTSVLEAMAMGAFPVQTNTACCDEWFEDGVGGFAIPHDEFDVICDRFHRALTDDALVDAAAIVNRRTVESRLAQQVITPRVVGFYRELFGHLGRQIP